MSSRLVPSNAEIRDCWRNTARLQQAAGKTAEAKHSRWVAANFRTAFPTKRPEQS